MPEDTAPAAPAEAPDVRQAEQATEPSDTATSQVDTRAADTATSADTAAPMDAQAAMPGPVAAPEAPTDAAIPDATAPDTASPEATGAVAPAAFPQATAPQAPAASATVTVPADAGPIALREAAEAGDPAAFFEIGARYSGGIGTKADNSRAAEWYQRAAELGLAPAQYRIGNMYEKGVGVERDLKKAKTWYQMAAEQGNASAMHNLAVLYAMGADGTTDNESAARWFTKAGELGVKDSQFNLGILNAKGVGMPQNLEESYKWFALVAKEGDRDAAAKRDEIANSLRPEQLERARAAAELWKAKPVDPASNVVDIPDSWKEGQEKTASVDMKKAVKTIQLILNKNGYDAGGADGVMGAKTKNAIVAFQRDNGLPANGEVTEKLVQALLARK
jgi:localization factor PodJL